MKVCKVCLIEKDKDMFYEGRNMCKLCRKEQKDNWRNENSEKVANKCKEYRKLNIEKINNYEAIYRENNKEKKKEYNLKYRIENQEKIYKRVYEYNKRRMSEDILFSMSQNIRSSIRMSLNSLGYKKTSRTHEILGCTFEEFKLYLESKFESWMNWDNRGLYNGELNYGWDIDHIIPSSSALTEEEILRLNHYTNLQPLCSYTNRYIKGDKIIQI